MIEAMINGLSGLVVGFQSLAVYLLIDRQKRLAQMLGIVAVV